MGESRVWSSEKAGEYKNLPKLKKEQESKREHFQGSIEDVEFKLEAKK